MMEFSLIRDEELDANKAIRSQQTYHSWGHIDLAVCSEGEQKSSDGLDLDKYM